MTEVIDSRRREFLGATALIISGAIIGVPAMTTIEAVAADYRQNPFTLVYDGAITKACRRFFDSGSQIR